MKNIMNINAKFRSSLANELEYAFELDNVYIIDDHYVIRDVDGNTFETYDKSEAVRMYTDCYAKGEPYIVSVPWYVEKSEFRHFCIVTTLQAWYGNDNLIEDGTFIYAKVPNGNTFVEDANYPYIIYVMDESLADAFIAQQNANGCCMGRIRCIELYDKTFDAHFRYSIVPVSITEQRELDF